MHVPIKKAIDWVAQNDESSCLDITEIRWHVTTLMIADLFGKDPGDIACRIYHRRKEYLSKESDG